MKVERRVVGGLGARRSRLLEDEAVRSEQKTATPKMA